MEASQQSVPQVSIDELARQHARGATVLDVRGRGEYRAGHVPGATNIPLAYLVGRLGEVPTGEDVYVICQTGVRSQMGAEMLRSHGIDARNVTHGTTAWIEAGHAVVQGNDPA